MFGFNCAAVLPETEIGSGVYCTSTVRYIIHRKIQVYLPNEYSTSSCITSKGQFVAARSLCETD